ncbi:MAG: Fur family transcriptional regulator [Syntrophobacteria bacterium]
MKSEVEVFREYVRGRGLRNTPEREQVLKAIFSIHDHFDVEQLALVLRRQESKISKATIYRNLPLFLESGLIRKAFFDNGHQYYEHSYGNPEHCHLRCLDCGKVVEFTDEAMEEVEERLEKRHDFLVTGHKLEVYGYCPRCRTNH